MTHHVNYAPVSNQAGVQNIHGNVIFSDLSPAYKRSRKLVDGTKPDQLLNDDIISSLAFPQMLDRRSNIDSAYVQTCQWLFDLNEYRCWKNEPRGLLWIKGKPGSGKSTLMAHLHRKIWLERHIDHDISLEFFFNARGSLLQYNLTGMLRSLILQLFHQDPDVRRPLRAAYEEKSSFFGDGNGTKWEWQLAELKRLFMDVISASAQKRQVVLLVDALDEAGVEAAQEITRYIHAINEEINNSMGRARICISCRHYLITSNIEVAEICMENNNYGDIAFFVEDHFRKVQTIANNDRQDRTVIIKTLVDRANGVFQWVRLVTPMVIQWLGEGDTTEQVHASLSKVPSGLESIYDHILENVIQTRHRGKALRLFQWVCFAERPLSIKELQFCLSAEDIELGEFPKRCHETAGFETSSLLITRRVMIWSGGLLEIVSTDQTSTDSDVERTLDLRCDEKCVQVIHQSVKEFIITRGLSYLLLFDHRGPATKNNSLSDLDAVQTAQMSHGILYLSCLKYLCTEIPDRSIVSREAALDKYPFLDYSTCFGLSHAEKSANHRGLLLEDESRLLNQSLPMCIFGYEVLRFQLNTVVPHIDAGTTILHLASAANLFTLVEYRIKHGDIPNSKDAHGWTPVHMAAASGNLSILVTLANARYDMLAKTRKKLTPLYLAAEHGHHEAFRFLMGCSSDLYALNRDLKTALQAASLHGHVVVCKICLEAGTNVNALGGPFDTALQAAATGGSREIVRLLLEAGADVNAQGVFYGQALQAAASIGNAQIVRILLEAGADVNAQGGSYGQALQAAAASIGNAQIVRILLEAGADVNAQGGKFGNALQAAVYNGNGESIRVLLEAGANINTQGGRYGNVLQFALWCGSEETVRILLEAGANIHAQGGDYGNALHAAAYYGSEEKVRMLLKAGANIHAQGGKYGNALQAAADCGSEETVRMLLEAGANVNAQGGKHGNALHAATSEGHKRIIRILLEAGADVNAQGGEYGNALQAAAYRGKEETVRILLEAGADVNAQGGKYGNALQAATYRGSEETVRILLEAGADVNAQGGEYGNALQAAACRGKEEKVRILLEAGADVHAQGGEYGNALQAAAYSGSEETVRMLLEAGANVNAQGGGYYSQALQAAAFRGSEAVVRMLLEAGADVNAQGGEYGNALQAAADCGSEETVRILLKVGADINAQGGEHGNALHAATSGGHKRIIRILLEAGADVNVQ